MGNEKQLANFAEWNPQPIFMLSNAGDIVYANLVARTHFPELLTQGLAHPLLKGLDKILQDFQLKDSSGFIVYNRDISFNKKSYEQQILGLADAGIYIYLSDITESLQLKTQAHFNDKLASIGMMAAGVAHEINNPITWILGNLNLIKSLLDATQAQQNQKELITQIDEIIKESLQGLERIQDLTKNLKSLARADTTELGCTDIHKILHLVISMVSIEFKNKVSINKNFAAQMPKILSNGGKLHQVFLNLLVNAAQSISAEDGSRLEITVTTQIENKQVRVDISDTGKGIPPDVLPKIFEPFFTTKPPDQGTGLGLSICQDVMHDLKGEIKVKSCLNQGSTFSVYLPLHPVEETVLNKAQGLTQSSSNRRILVVDNEPAILKLLKRILEGQHQLVTISTGPDAQQIIDRNQGCFDIIITDLNMPDISGADLYRYTADKYPGLEKRFIFMTGGVDIPWVNEFLENKKYLILEKPFMPADVIRLINSFQSRV